MGMFKPPKIDPAPVTPPPIDPARVEAPDPDAIKNAKARAEIEAARRGRSKLRIPLGGLSGASGISIPTMG